VADRRPIDGGAMTEPEVGVLTDPDELALVAAGFPAFRIWRQTFWDRTRYTAQARELTTHPNTVVTGDLAELRAALRPSR
jgi:hypothetical protein